MASDKPQSEILDLLYDDELDEQMRAAAREHVEQSDEAREELEAYESMLAQIRAADLDEDVPESVHDSIMAAARNHTAKNASRQAQVTRRAPTPSKSTKSSLWSRLNSSGVSQLVLAAAVVLVGGFLFVNIGSKREDGQKFMAANQAVDEQVSFGGDSSGQLAQKAPAAETSEPVEELLAEDQPAEDQPAEDQPAEGEPARGEMGPAPSADKKSELGELAMLDQFEKKEKPAKARSPEPNAPAQNAGREAKRKDESRSVQRRRARKSATRKKGPSDDQIDVFQGSSSPSVDTTKSRPAPKAAEKKDSTLDQALGRSSSSGSAPGSGVTDNAALGNKLGELADSSPDSDSEETYAEPAQAQQEAAEEQASGVNTMESNYRSGNFAGVVTQADRYLSRSSEDQADEARVLELKARALARQSKSSEADEVYAELQKKYPSYKSDQIRRERAELTKKRKSQAERRRAPAEAMEREEADSMDDVDQPQPSSLDNAY
jgi:hypothetical protein